MNLPKLPAPPQPSYWQWRDATDKVHHTPILTESQTHAYGVECWNAAIVEAALLIHEQMNSCSDSMLRGILMSHVNAIKELKK